MTESPEYNAAVFAMRTWQGNVTREANRLKSMLDGFGKIANVQ